jgi:hypothetical protein
VMSRMIGVLAGMHERNPAWGSAGRASAPLPGDASRPRVA